MDLLGCDSNADRQNERDIEIQEGTAPRERQLVVIIDGMISLRIEGNHFLVSLLINDTKKSIYDKIDKMNGGIL